MPLKFSNNATATLAASISPTSTSLTVTTGQGALFPALAAGDYFYAALVDSSNNIEFIKVTARSGDTLTAVRGQESTAARSYLAADKLVLRVTAAGMSSMAQLAADQTFSGVNTFTTPPTLGAPLPIASGGTGVTSSTGSGAVVFATSPTLASPTLTTPTIAGATMTGDLGLGTNQLATTNFTVVESGGKLLIKYGGTTIFSISSTGAVIAASTVTGVGTP